MVEMQEMRVSDVERDALQGSAGGDLSEAERHRAVAAFSEAHLEAYRTHIRQACIGTLTSPQ